MLFDSHAHLNFNAYSGDVDEVTRRALDKNIHIINVGTQFDTSKSACELTQKYSKGLYAAIGIHPIHLTPTEVDEEETSFKSREEEFEEKKYQDLVDKYPKIVAIGEIGLDYFHRPKDTKTLKHKNTPNQSKLGTGQAKTFEEIKKIQEREFLKQVEFANKNNLPLILHCRGERDDPLQAYRDLLKLLSSVESRKSKVTGVIHCFGANVEIAEEFIKLGFYVGFTGIITFGKNADSVREVVKNIPLEKILVETDCPYLSPDPFRGKRNEPAYVEYIAKKIAEIKNVDYPKVADVSTKNVKELFRID